MRTPKRVVLFCVLFLIFLSFKPLQAYDTSLFSGLEVADSRNPAGAKVFAIKENSPPLQSDLRINDVITSIEGQTVSSLEDFVRISTALKDKESVSLSVHRWGKVFEIALGKKSVGEQAKPETSVQAEPPPKQAEAKTAQKGFENPVVPNATGITYRHGQYPSEGNNTHPGVDIVADCGTPIYAFADGQVTNLIKEEKDRNFDSLGYMIIIKHLEPINGKDAYSLYLHMKEPPAVSKGQTVKAGDVLGKVGDTGKADGCHVHFEIRHFSDRFLNDKGWNYPLNIYGKGDQRNEKRFLENWEDPEVYFKKYPSGMVRQEAKPQPETQQVAEGERIEDYFPIQDGARWEYQMEISAPNKTLFGTEYVVTNPKAIVECKVGVDFQGREAVMLHEEESWPDSPGTVQVKKYFQKQKDALLYLGHEVTSQAGQWIHIFEPPLANLREPVILHSSWDISSSDRGKQGAGPRIKGTITVGGKEEIEVPAGRFEAIKLISRTNLGEVTEWLAKGVGLVKKIETFEVKGQGGKQTTKYELVSYSPAPTLLGATQGKKTYNEQLKLKKFPVNFRLGECSDISYRWVIGDVPSEVDLSSDETTRQILEQAAHFAEDRCSKGSFSNIKVTLYQENQEVVSARNYDESKLSWFEYYNRALEERLAKSDSLLDKERRQQEWVYTDPETGVRFACGRYFSSNQIVGEVPTSTDLKNNEIAKKLLIKGKDIWLFKSPYEPKEEIIVYLYAGPYMARDQKPNALGYFKWDFDRFDRLDYYWNRVGAREKVQVAHMDKPIQFENLEVSEGTTLQEIRRGSLIVSGELKNVGESPLHQLIIKIYLLNENGVPIFESPTYTLVKAGWSFQERKNSLKPDCTRKFSLDIDGIPSTWEKARVEVLHAEFEDIKQFKERHAYLDKVKDKILEAGETSVSGEVTNLGDRTLTGVEITVYFLDENKKQIATTLTYPTSLSGPYTDNLPLKPGYSRRFSAGVVSRYGEKKPQTVRTEVADIEFAEAQEEVSPLGTIQRPSSNSSQPATLAEQSSASKKETGAGVQTLPTEKETPSFVEYDAKLWRDKGFALYRLGKYKEAITCYDKALEIDPKDAIAWSDKGAALYGLRRYKEAITCYDKALEIDPKNTIVWSTKGTALYELGRYKEAITCYDKVLEINPGSVYERDKKAKVEAATFVKKYKIKRVADPEKLFSNPFVYKGERIAICLEFAMMSAENEAVFGSEKDGIPLFQFIISGVPSTAFMEGEYTLATRVLGLTEPKVELQILGTGIKSKSVPHLEFLGHEPGDLTKYIAEVLKKE